MKTPGNQNPRLSIRPEKNTGQVINMKYINNLASLKVFGSLAALTRSHLIGDHPNP